MMHTTISVGDRVQYSTKRTDWDGTVVHMVASCGGMVWVRLARNGERRLLNLREALRARDAATRLGTEER